MADIRSYMKEKEKRERKQEGYKEKIVKHKLAHVYRIILLILVAVALAVLVVIQYGRHVYTDYDVISSMARESVSGSFDIRLGDAILTYSKDGAHCTDTKGNVTWNQNYEIQDIKLALCNGTTAIAEYNGRNIYTANTEKQLTQITTTMPIRNIAVSQGGYVTAILDGTDVAVITTYDPAGKESYRGEARMNGSGYPAAISLSPGGELLCVSYWYVDAGTLKTNIAFYNFGPIGENANDHMVSVYSYTDMLVPQVQFMNDSTAFAVGDNRLMIYSGGHIPVEAAWYALNEEIQSVFYNDKYIGLVFRSEKEDKRFRMDVYDAAANSIGSFYLDIDYTDIFFEQDKFIAYNEMQCVITTLDGVEKFNGEFTKPVKLVLPTGRAYRYLLVTEDSMDTIQLR